MAYPSKHYGLRSNGALRVVLVLLAIFFVGYIVGSGLFSKGSSNAASCSCDCDCSQELELIWTVEFINNSYPDCGKHNPEMGEEMQKNAVDLISDEIELQRRVANERLEQTRTLVITARSTSSQYQIEAQKCSAHTQTCEEGRERAEAGLVEERKLTALWEQRALELGWGENITYADNNTIHSLKKTNPIGEVRH